ncbi:hypothetical protein AV530_014408 [Patagioenas fasciata monilis]|uniref:Uncharacterized protein n=1 Tax=Patagioenas fasciata monilis TaxID=372326 RepID=A0A1V4KBW1_PATFA|nr:hypothetical protein AV530_014408 [Patagioenas fasciata monilis]
MCVSFQAQSARCTFLNLVKFFTSKKALRILSVRITDYNTLTSGECFLFSVPLLRLFHLAITEPRGEAWEEEEGLMLVFVTASPGIKFIALQMLMKPQNPEAAAGTENRVLSKVQGQMQKIQEAVWLQVARSHQEELTALKRRSEFQHGHALEGEALNTQLIYQGKSV